MFQSTYMLIGAASLSSIDYLQIRFTYTLTGATTQQRSVHSFSIRPSPSPGIYTFQRVLQSSLTHLAPCPSTSSIYCGKTQSVNMYHVQCMCQQMQGPGLAQRTPKLTHRMMVASLPRPVHLQFQLSCSLMGAVAQKGSPSQSPTFSDESNLLPSGILHMPMLAEAQTGIAHFVSAQSTSSHNSC